MAKYIKVFDTTLSDGEQSPGCSMNISEKIELAKMLEKLNVDVIEAGFAVSSPGDFESVKAISKAVTTPIVCSLARATIKDIDRAWEALQEAKRPRIHIFLATSEIHMKYKLKMTANEVIAKAVESIKYAKSLNKNIEVEFSAEDASRSDKEFLVKIFGEAIAAGATIINIPDTVGYTMPAEFGELIRYIKEHTVGIESVDLSVHCHNDLGLAIANSLTAIKNGATQVETTINGIGERAGNAALEELVMALNVRKDHYGPEKQTQINTKLLYPASRLLTSITGVQVQQNKAIVGANAFAHEAGIHQDGVLKHRETYEIMSAKDIGMVDNKLILGKHSGRHAFVARLKELGIEEPNETKINELFTKFKQLADKKKNVTERDILTLAAEETKQLENIYYNIKNLYLETGTDIDPTAEIVVSYQGDQDISKKATGNGPVDAIFKTIDDIVKKDKLNIELIDYIVHAVTKGTDALGEVTVRIKRDSNIFTGYGADTDVMIASAQAYLNAINKLITYNKKGLS